MFFFFCWASRADETLNKIPSIRRLASTFFFFLRVKYLEKGNHFGQSITRVHRALHYPQRVSNFFQLNASSNDVICAIEIRPNQSKFIWRNRRFPWFLYFFFNLNLNIIVYQAHPPTLCVIITGWTYTSPILPVKWTGYSKFLSILIFKKNGNAVARKLKFTKKKIDRKCLFVCSERLSSAVWRVRSTIYFLSSQGGGGILTEKLHQSWYRWNCNFNSILAPVVVVLWRKKKRKKLKGRGHWASKKAQAFYCYERAFQSTAAPIYDTIPPLLSSFV